MTFEQFIKQLGIEAGRQYSVKEVAGMLGVVPATVGAWCRVGLRLDGSRVTVQLSSFMAGGHVVIPSECLVEFLRLRNNAVD